MKQLNKLIIVASLGLMLVNNNVNAGNLCAGGYESKNNDEKKAPTSVVPLGTPHIHPAAFSGEHKPADNPLESTGTSTLHAAASSGNVMILGMKLKEAKAVGNLAEVVNQQSHLTLQTPLHLAAENKQYAVATLLINTKVCDVNAVDGTGFTPLQLATFVEGNAPMVTLLIKHGANADMDVDLGSGRTRYARLLKKQARKDRK